MGVITFNKPGGWTIPKDTLAFFYFVFILVALIFNTATIISLGADYRKEKVWVGYALAAAIIHMIVEVTTFILLMRLYLPMKKHHTKYVAAFLTLMEAIALAISVHSIYMNSRIDRDPIMIAMGVQIGLVCLYLIKGLFMSAVSLWKRWSQGDDRRSFAETRPRSEAPQSEYGGYGPY